VSAIAVRERWTMGVEGRALVIITAVLVAFGLAVLYSASSIVAMQQNLDGSFFFLRQVTGVLAGVFVLAVLAKVDAERWYGWAWPLMGLTLFLMLLLVLPFTESIAPRILGSRRFIFGGGVQPAELAKLAVVVWTAMLVVKKGDALRGLRRGLLPFLVVIGLLNFLAILQPDLSMALHYTLVMCLVLFAGGARIGHFIFLLILSAPLLFTRIESLQYAVLRTVSFLDPGRAPEALGYQLNQSLIAIGSGQLFGQGFGQGRQQYGFLPLGYNDFIASHVGEEWGFLGMVFIVGCFALYGYLGFRIARQARSRFQQLVAVGITATVVLTAYVHIGVALGVLPNAGLTLPFISYGRSNLVLTLAMTGILLNIASQRERVVGEGATDPLALAAR
jgi:cell division protein FtsW